MKSALALILMLGSSISFAMAEKDANCYAAQNPGVIIVEPVDGTPDISVGVEAMVKIATQIYDGKEDGYAGQMQTAHMKIRTNLEWKVEVAAFLNDGIKSNLPTYSVECDGGSMTVKQIDDSTVVLNSKYIAGEMTRADEGCSTARLQFKDLVMKKQECK